MNFIFLLPCIILCSQTHVQIKYSPAYLQDLIPTLAGVFAYYYILAEVGIKSCRYA